MLMLKPEEGAVLWVMGGLLLIDFGLCAFGGPVGFAVRAGIRTLVLLLILWRVMKGSEWAGALGILAMGFRALVTLIGIASDVMGRIANMITAWNGVMLMAYVVSAIAIVRAYGRRRPSQSNTPPKTE